MAESRWHKITSKNWKMQLISNYCKIIGLLAKYRMKFNFSSLNLRRRRRSSDSPCSRCQRKFDIEIVRRKKIKSWEQKLGGWQERWHYSKPFWSFWHIFCTWKINLENVVGVVTHPFFFGENWRVKLIAWVAIVYQIRKSALLLKHWWNLLNW